MMLRSGFCVRCRADFAVLPKRRPRSAFRTAREECLSAESSRGLAHGRRHVRRDVGGIRQGGANLFDRQLVLADHGSTLSPAAINPTTVATSIRVPAMQGLPKRTSGFLEIPGKTFIRSATLRGMFHTMQGKAVAKIRTRRLCAESGLFSASERWSPPLDYCSWRSDHAGYARRTPSVPAPSHLSIAKRRRTTCYGYWEMRPSTARRNCLGLRPPLAAHRVASSRSPCGARTDRNDRG